MRRGLERLGWFESVLDVGGNVGGFAELARELWPDARITSFEPIPAAAKENARRAGGRWKVEPVAISNGRGTATLNVCVNQHSASSMMEAGPVRRERFGLHDRRVPIEVDCRLLDEYLAECVTGRLLVKVDVEGHERQVLEGSVETLAAAAAVLVEVQADPGVFVGAPPPGRVDEMLRAAGLFFAGVLDALHDPAGELVQFDGVWRRLEPGGYLRHCRHGDE